MNQVMWADTNFTKDLRVALRSYMLIPSVNCKYPGLIQETVIMQTTTISNMEWR